jgi:hypothetical protein
MDENRRLDDELAEMTDAILENREMKPSDEMNDLADVVRGLRDVIQPGDTPSRAFEERMKQRLDLEWEQRQRRTMRMRVNPAVRLVALAAALVVVLVVIIFITNTPPESGDLPGAAGGPIEFLIALIAVGAVVGAAFLVWRNRR